MNQRGEVAAQLAGEERALGNGGHDLEPRKETADQVALRDTLVERRERGGGGGRREGEGVMRTPLYLMSCPNYSGTSLKGHSCIKDTLLHPNYSGTPF